MHNNIQPLLLLCTGTIVIIANQVVSNQGAVSPKAQWLTVVRYLFTCALSALLVALERRRSRKTPAAHAAANKKDDDAAAALTQQSTPAAATDTAAGPKPRVILLVLLVVGCLDVGCYSLYNLGFALCGSALATIVLAASGQIATAVLSVLILKRQLRARHIAAVTVVTVGLTLRSMDDILAGTFFSSSTSAAAASASQQQTFGVLCVMLSALLFSVLGIVYEKRSENPNRKVSQAQASFAVSGVSLSITLIHQMLYCVPNWQTLVTVPLAASGLRTRTVLITHAVYGLITAVHQYVQLRVLASHGAMSVGLVNAVRASVVSVVSSLLFCGVKPQLCLTFWRAASAVVVTLGAVQWVFAGKPLTQQLVDKKKQA